MSADDFAPDPTAPIDVLREDVEVTLSGLRIATGMASGEPIPAAMTDGALDMVMAAVDRYRAALHDAVAQAPAIPSTAQVTEYRLSPVPKGVSPDGRHWDVVVRRFGDTDRWVVKSTDFEFYAKDDATWHDTAYRWAADTGEWMATYTWPLGEALALADKAQWTQVINGKTAVDVLAKRGEAKP